MSDVFVLEEIDGIHIHTFVTSEDRAIDEWAAAFRQAVEATPPEQPFYILVDVSGEDVYFTPYARETTQKLFTTYRHRQGYISFVFVWLTGPHVARLFFASLGKLEYAIQPSGSREEGLAWLRQMRAG